MPGRPPSDMLDLVFGDTGRGQGAFFSADRYGPLCNFAATVNGIERGAVSLVLPVKGKVDGVDIVSTDMQQHLEGPFLTLACVNVQPHTAFILASGLPLHKPTRDVLADNGLSVQDLTLREARLDAQYAGKA